MQNPTRIAGGCVVAQRPFVAAVPWSALQILAAGFAIGRGPVGTAPNAHEAWEAILAAATVLPLFSERAVVVASLDGAVVAWVAADRSALRSHAILMLQADLTHLRVVSSQQSRAGPL